jgi:purine-binding chemotaxis protein CheW
VTEHDQQMHPVSMPAEDILARFLKEAGEDAAKNAAGTGTGGGEASFHLVTFHLASEEYGLDIGRVQEIIRATDITIVPGAQEHVSGVINLRGKIIPVIDLRKRFRLPEGTVSDARRIIVVELGDKRLGMLVDDVAQVMKVSAADIEEIPEEAMTIDGNYILGIGKVEDRLVIMLDLNRSLLAA